MIELVERIPEPLRLLYVLVVSRGREQSGRYEAASGMSFDDTEILRRSSVTSFSPMGGIISGSTSPGFGTIVYDRHDVLYTYGPLDRFVEVLKANGLKEGKVRTPRPHTGTGLYPEFDESQSRVLSRFQWIHSRLHPGDDA